MGAMQIHYQRGDRLAERRGPSHEAIQILLEEIEFAWHEILGVPPNANAAPLRLSRSLDDETGMSA
jgi:hypothetical protein